MNSANFERITNPRHSILSKRRRSQFKKVPATLPRRIWRPDLQEDSTMANMILAAVKATPRPSSFEPRGQRDFGVTILGGQAVDQASMTYRGILPNPYDYIKQSLKEVAPNSLTQPLGEIAVVGVIPIGSKHSPTLALALSSPELANEVRTLEEACCALSGTSVIEPLIPHVSLGTFNNSKIPASVIAAVEAAAPQTFSLDQARGFIAIDNAAPFAT